MSSHCKIFNLTKSRKASLADFFCDEFYLRIAINKRHINIQLKNIIINIQLKNTCRCNIISTNLQTILNLIHSETELIQ